MSNNKENVELTEEQKLEIVRKISPPGTPLFMAVKLSFVTGASVQTCLGMIKTPDIYDLSGGNFRLVITTFHDKAPYFLWQGAMAPKAHIRRETASLDEPYEYDQLLMRLARQIPLQSLPSGVYIRRNDLGAPCIATNLNGHYVQWKEVA